MANNRIQLVHKDTGRCVCITKTMGYDWYLPSTLSVRLPEFLKEYTGDFLVAIEEADVNYPEITDIIDFYSREEDEKYNRVTLEGE